MSSAYESAQLIVKLYELRREPTMREARTWFVRSFNPSSIDDLMQTMNGPNSAQFRMVTSYWEMAASFVNHGAIDEQMFNDANGEQLSVFSKVEGYLPEFRQRLGNPGYLANLEQLIGRTPGAKERMAVLRERFKTLAAAGTAR